MKEVNWCRLVVVLGWVICGLVFAVTHLACRMHNLRHEAITRGFAAYNATNGVWEWRKP